MGLARVQVGTVANDGTGDTSRAAWQKYNAFLANNILPNVSDYGAIVGAADNSAAINAALADAATLGLQRVLIANKYNITSGINMVPNVDLIGITENAELIQNGAAPAISAVGFQKVASALTADALIATYTITVASGPAIVVGGMVNIIEDVTGEEEVNVVKGVAGNVVTLYYPLSRGYTVANSGRCINIDPFVKPTVRDLKVTVTTGYIGINFHHCDRPQVTGCEVIGGRHGVTVEVCLRPLIFGNSIPFSGVVGPDGPGISFRAVQGGRIESNEILGQRVDEPIVLYKNCQGVKIIGNEIAGCVGAGIYADTRNRHCIIALNTIIAPGGLGIYVVTQNYGIKVYGNIIRDAGLSAIRVEASNTDTSVVGNTATNCAGYGLQIDAGSTRVTYADNDFPANSSGAISDGQTTFPAPAIGGPLVVNALTAATRVSYASRVGTRVVTAWTTSWTPDLSTGDIQELTASTSGVAFTAQPPISGVTALKWTMVIKNTSGGALGTLTLDAVYKHSGVPVVANGFRINIVWYADGANWVEESRSAAVPN